MFKNPEAWLPDFEPKVLNEWATKAGIDPIELEGYLINFDDKHITVFIYQSVTEDDEKALKQVCEDALKQGCENASHEDWKVKMTRLLGR